MEKYITIKKGKEASIYRRHPWIFSGAIQLKNGNPVDGDIVEIRDILGNVLGFGHYQNFGSIAVRVLSFTTDNYSEEFWFHKLKNAFDVRNQILVISDATDCYRLIHGEGDHLPGLIIDIYGKHAVIQCHSTGMYHSISMIAKALAEVYQGSLETIYCKSNNTLPNNTTGEADFFIEGSTAETLVKENGHSFYVNWVEGQKTGFFLDQRENRALTGYLSGDKKIFNAFCYTGGFSVYALAQGAKYVTSIDGSKLALDQLERNISINELPEHRHKTVKSDVKSWLKSCRPESIDLGIVDPPAYAKNHSVRHKASMAYKVLNAEAIKTIVKGGYMLTFSCSQAIDNNMFRSIIFSAGIEAKRDIRIIKQLSQGPDHPVNLFHPEGEYLKGLLLHID